MRTRKKKECGTQHGLTLKHYATYMRHDLQNRTKETNKAQHFQPKAGRGDVCLWTSMRKSARSEISPSRHWKSCPTPPRPGVDQAEIGCEHAQKLQDPIWVIKLVPRGRDPFAQRQESRPLRTIGK